MHYHLSAIDLGYNLPDGSNLFNSLTFSFNPVRTGLIGRNGVGKSTLLDLLAGQLAPSAGSINEVGKISYLPQSDSIAAGATVASALRNYRGTLIVVSHDREFLEEIGIERSIGLPGKPD